MTTIYEDSTTITTPDGLTIEVRLAGLGSRFASDLLDTLIKLAIILLIAGLGAVGGFGAAVVSIAAFVVYFGYDVFFETLHDGRTPGKKQQGTRVVRTGGQAVGFVASTIRNVVRLIDILPGFYGVGAIAILGSARNQRLGDVAAGTLVIRDRTAEAAPVTPALAMSQKLREVRVDVAGVSPEEWEAVSAFLRRRDALSPEVRTYMAHTLAAHLRPKVPGTADLADEAVLERIRIERG